MSLPEVVTIDGVQYARSTPSPARPECENYVTSPGDTFAGMPIPSGILLRWDASAWSHFPDGPASDEDYAGQSHPDAWDAGVRHAMALVSAGFPDTSPSPEGSCDEWAVELAAWVERGLDEEVAEGRAQGREEVRGAFFRALGLTTNGHGNVCPVRPDLDEL